MTIQEIICQARRDCMECWQGDQCDEFPCKSVKTLSEAIKGELK